MIFAGVDPGSESYAISLINEIGSLVRYYEIPTMVLPHESIKLVKEILDYNPICIALPSGHGLPFTSIDEIGDREIFLMTLADPNIDGPLHSMLRAFRFIRSSSRAFTIPSVVELDSVPSFRKIWIDMGTAEKVASAFFYVSYFNLSNFILVEMGRHFSSIVIVKDQRIIDGFGGSVIPGIKSIGSLDGEVAYLFNKAGIKITKDMIYFGSNKERALEIIEILSQSLSSKYGAKIIVSGPAKEELKVGEKIDLPFKESSVGSAMIASSLCGGAYRDKAEMLKSSGSPISFLKMKRWDEVISWTKI
ncbi:DUF1464 family protein [Sulfuracidifex metallicus]|uniref:DUF1464 domain-containing protein n=1 Tax=Sulfuracidifex metallicus DSM 6482 = JCM 9184 TaxID=523847 RepID=A0A6A9QJ30_SULME|nr:DUF1464 family protein [Sulfuracidifex metallicus]MUN28674.1 DUF1464 domain-containing protein [Sulfuracidifex metallicus DSM 6482 = JCM 9184]WOE50801.1 DUF1464 family protein [Sulfuracidifex metallicus DSM 6482 = JCM 9184]